MKLKPIPTAIQTAVTCLISVGIAHASDEHQQTDGSSKQSSSRHVDTLPAVKVRDKLEPESVTGPLRGYTATRSATATKTDTPIKNIPQSLSVIGVHEMEAKGMRDVLDTVNYTPGVFTRTWGHDSRGYEFLSLRGFSSSQHNYLDGLSQLEFVDVGVQTEVYGLERVEVLRGPSSATFGRGDVGGVINRVSKRPSLGEQVREVQGQLGNFRHQQLALDYGGRLGEESAYRLVALRRTNADHEEYPTGERVKTRRHYLAPSFLWNPEASTSLTLLGSMMRHDTGDDIGYIADGEGRSTNIREGDPRYSRILQNSWTLGYEFHHAFNDRINLRQNFRYADREADKHHIWSSLEDDKRTLKRTAVHGVGHLKQTSLDTFLETRIESGTISHKIVGGVDFSHFSGSEVSRAGEAPSLDLLNPIYREITPPTEVDSNDGPNKVRGLGLYVQDQIRIEKNWLVTLSGRHDTVKAEDGSATRDSTERHTHKAFTGRAALSWIGESGLTPYLSYGTSFQPQIGAFDESFDAKPTKGKQWEAGVKYQPENGELLLTAAVFSLDKENITISNPDTGLNEQVGAIRSQGIELEAKGRINPNLFLTASYSYNNIKGKRGKTWYVEPEKSPIQTPAHTASLWLDYMINNHVIRGVRLGAGLRYVSKRWDDAENTKSQPGFTLIDTSISYDIDSSWNLRINANNLLNKRYFASNYDDGWFRGEQRTVTATLSYRW